MGLAYKGATFATPAATATVVAINYVDRTTKVRLTTLRIDDILNDAPNQATFTVVGLAPTVGQDVKIGVGGIGPSNRVFGGTIVLVTQIYEEVQANVAYQITCQDYTYLLRRRFPIGAYTSQSATAVAQDLIFRYASTTFTAANVAASLATVTIAFDGTQDLAACLTALATMAGCYWYPDANKDLHFFVTEATGNPTTIDSTNIAPTNPTGARQLAKTTDLTQERTRVYVRYKDTTTPLGAAVAATTLSVTNADVMASSGHVITNGQRVTYTGLGSGYVPHVNTWEAETAPAATGNWEGVAWAPSLSLFVAVQSSTVATSPDGITWTARSCPVSAFIDVAWAPSLGLFAMVSTTGAIATSPDGTTWTSQTSPLSSGGAITWSADLAKFVIVGTSGTPLGATSTDGVTWTGRTIPAGLWNGVAWSPSLALFAACGSFSTTCIVTSPDGVTWTARTTSIICSSIAWSDTLGLFVAVSATNVITSSNGTAWTTHATLNNNNWQRVIWASELGLFIAVARSASGGSLTTSAVAASSDGVTWTLYTAAGTGAWYGLAWAPTLGVLVASGINSGSPLLFFMTSTADMYSTLTGIPASGDGSITSAIGAGDTVTPEVQRDDVTAQGVLALLEGGDGVHEFVITDASIATATDANTRGDAELALFKSPVTELAYATRDVATRSGKTVTVSLGSPTSISVSLQIQQVTWSQFEVQGTYPLLTVKAAQTKFTLQDLLRKVTIAA